MTRVWSVVRAVWPPLVFGIAFLALWEAAVNVFEWKPYFLPKPSSIWTQFTDNLSSIRAAVAVMRGTSFEAPYEDHCRDEYSYGLCRIHTIGAVSAS